MQLGRRGEGRGGLFPRTNSIAVIMLNDVHYLLLLWSPVVQERPDQRDEAGGLRSPSTR